MKRTTAFLLIVIISLILVLSGCRNTTSTNDKTSSSSSTPPTGGHFARDPSEPRNESELTADIMNNKFYLEEYSRFTISDLTVIKRQTATDNKTDKVFVTIDVINGSETLEGHKENTIQGKVDLCLTYGLYNDGWILDTCEIFEDGQYGAGVFLVQEGLDLTEEQLLNIMYEHGHSADYITISDHQFDLEHQMETYSIHATKKHAYATEDWDVSVGCVFVGEKSPGYLGSLATWNFSAIGGFTKDINWNIKGTYQGENSGTVVHIPYIEPGDYMSLVFDGLERECSRLVDTYTLSLAHLAPLVSQYSSSTEKYVSSGYSVRLWDGQSLGYNKLSYSDFNYVVTTDYRIYTVLIGPEKIACIRDQAPMVDTVNHIVYVEIEELIPVN